MLVFKRIIAWLITNPLVGKIISFFKRNNFIRYNCQFILDSPLISPRVKALIFWGLYEKAEIDFIQRYLSNKYPVVELGGSLGIVSSVISKKIDTKHLFVVEANPELIPIINQHLNINKKNRFEVIHAGIGTESNLFFYKGNDNTVGVVSLVEEKGAIPIPHITLDDILKQKSIATYALVSDIEGAEINFIFDNPEALQKCKEIIIELHHCVQNGRIYTIEDQIKQLKSLGFCIMDRHGPVIFATK